MISVTADSRPGSLSTSGLAGGGTFPAAVLCMHDCRFCRFCNHCGKGYFVFTCDCSLRVILLVPVHPRDLSSSYLYIFESSSASRVQSHSPKSPPSSSLAMANQPSVFEAPDNISF